MISRTTKVTNNKFQVTFNFRPSNLTHSRTNNKGTYKATHIANGTTSRQGIWEGIEIVEVWTKIGTNAWRSHGASTSVTVETASNNVQIQGKAKYRLKTMGHHWNDFSGVYPFFWFGNIGGNPNKYAKGYYTDTKPVSPGNEHYYCVVPPDWTYKSCEWSDWAYKHGNATNNWAIAKGRYEQRNGNYEAAKETNGWIAESNNKQMWRKSLLFYFEKEYSNSVVSSGISTHPNTPNLSVNWAKGDSGTVTVKYTDNAGVAGKILLKAYCGNKTAEILNYNGVTFTNGQSRTIDVNFNNVFGEAYRGNNVYYEAWSKNNTNFQSQSSTGRVGTQRYNGRPTIPTGLRVSSPTGVIYNKIQISWNKATDPDGDAVVYDVWIRCKSKDGKVLKDDYVARGLNALTMEYDITNFSEESNIEIWVRSSDNLIVSDWCAPISCTKGAVPKGSVALLSPCVSGTNLYNKRPRFVFTGYDKVSEFIVVINNKEYSSVKNPTLFYSSNDRVIFKPDTNLTGVVSCYAYMKNQYGDSKRSMTYKFTIKDPYENVVEGEIMQAKVIKEIQSLIADFGKAFNKNFSYEVVNKEMYVTANTYNTCRDFLNSITTNINNLVPNTSFAYNLKCSSVQAGQLNDDYLWNKLVEELNNI